MRYLIFLFLFCNSSGQAFDYFSGKIDYWKKEKAEKPANKLIPKQMNPIKEEKKSDFDWSKFSDPNNPEFFKEGDHTPPEPFMEMARNPSDDNIKQWFALIDAKNALMGELHKRIGDYVAKNNPPLKADEVTTVKQSISQDTPIDFRRFRFRNYFDSTCPHCKNMLMTMQDLQNRGYYVEVKQIDNRKLDFPVPFTITKATEEELKAKNINAWPVTFVADTSKQLIYRLNGYLSTSEVLKILATK